MLIIYHITIIFLRNLYYLIKIYTNRVRKMIRLIRFDLYRIFSQKFYFIRFSFPKLYLINEKIH